MCELTVEEAGMPPPSPRDRRRFARQVHATVHEVVALRSLKVQCELVPPATLRDVLSLIDGMVHDRMQRIGLAPEAIDTVMTQVFAGSSAGQGGHA